MARKLPSLPRVLGAPALFAAAYAEIGSSLYFALGLTAAYALSLTPVVFVVAGLVFALAAAAYAEGATTFTDEAGAAALGRRAFNDLVGFVAGWATALDYVLVIALSALFVPHYLTGAILDDPDRLSEWEAAGAAAALIAAVAVVRVVRRPAWHAGGVAIALLDLVAQLALAVLGLLLVFDPEALRADIRMGEAPSWNALAFSLPIAMVAFTGLEKVASLAARARDPSHTVPAGVRSAVFTTVFLYAAVATAAVAAFPSRPDPGAPAGYSSDLSTTWFNAPLLGLANAIGAASAAWVGDVLRMAVGLTACAVLGFAVVTGFSGCATLAEGMGRHLSLPAVLARPSRRTGSPSFAILATGALAVVFVLVGTMFEDEEALALAALYSFGILIAFMLAQAALIWLRLTEPDLPRPFLMRGNVRVRGRLVPVTSVIGLAVAFAAWVVALGTHPGARVLGPLWLVAGLAVYATVRVRAGIPLLDRVETVEALPELADAEYRTIVVALERLGPIADEMAATACRLAVEGTSKVVGVTALALDLREPLDAPAPELEDRARRVQTMAATLAAEYGVPYAAVVRRARNPGRVIVDAAAEHDADLIVIGAPQKRRAAQSLNEEFFGRTVDFVLAKAPCRVIVTHFPAGAAEADEAVAGAPAGAAVTT
jgi:basic amino acid/polyamine antiporter, APA family